MPRHASKPLCAAPKNGCCGMLQHAAAAHVWITVLSGVTVNRKMQENEATNCNESGAPGPQQRQSPAPLKTMVQLYLHPAQTAHSAHLHFLGVHLCAVP